MEVREFNISGFVSIERALSTAEWDGTGGRRQRIEVYIYLKSLTLFQRVLKALQQQYT
jgi:hypothetical protein